jgi:hypothetical protein
MARLGRYNLSEISIGRLALALRTRVAELPHSVAWEVLSSARENKARLGSLAGKHSGERCFVVANGPSLQKTNLEHLAGETTFGLNRIYLHFEASGFRPTYFVAMNELILEQFADEIAELGMPKFLNWNRRSCIEREHEDLYFLKSRMSIKDSFQYDLTRSLVVGATVTFVALQLAYYMGFREVILVGLDHKYQEKGIPSKTERRTSERDESHFHPNYFPKGSRWQLPDLLRAEIDFQLARGAFERDGRRVLDATIGGMCTVFEKVDFHSVVEGKS